MTHPIRDFHGPLADRLDIARTLLLALAMIGGLAVLAGCDPMESDGGDLHLRGILTEESTECETLRTEDGGELYALTGDLGDVRSGDLVEVTGTLVRDRTCDGSDRVVHVTTIDVIGGPSASARASARTEEERYTGRDADGEMPIGEAGTSGQLLLEGELTDEGVECPAFRADDGTLYTLTGDLGDVTTGDRVRVVGTPTDISICQQGRTLEVVEIGLVPPREAGETGDEGEEGTAGETETRE